jgi:outer membrane protein insertion porin family
MNRTFSLCLAAVLLAGSALAQTAQPAPQPPPQPKAGTIIDRPDPGRITSEPSATPAPATPRPGTAATGPRIERFEAVGNVSVASDTIRVYLGVNPGDPYDPAALQRNFLNLWQTGLFDDIRIETDNAPSGGIIVRAVVKERPRIGAVEYRGNKELNAAKITEQLDKDKIDLHVGNTLEQTLVRRAAESIKKAYSEGGFEGVTVDTTLEDMGDSDKKIVFNVSEGIKATVARIVFTGNDHFSSRRLKKQMKEVKENNIVTWIRKKNLYIPSKLDEDLEHVKNYYQDYGYTNVAFGEPQLTTIGTAKKPRVRITIPIKEGTIHRLGDVTVTGATVFKPEAFTGNFPVKKGDVIRRKPIQDRVDALDELYRMRGFIYSYINPEYVERDNNIVDVHFAVFEGEQFRLGRLEFQGNTTTKDKVLRREIFLEEGEIMDMETFKQSIYKLGQLGYFKVNDNPDFKVNQEKKSVDVTVKGTEEGKNDVQFGGGYSEGTGFFVQTQFSTRNFLGEGENLGLSFQRGNRQNFYSLSYADPWFMDTPNSFGVSLFNRNTDFPLSVGYQERSRGGSIAYGYRLHRFDSLSLVYGLEHVRTHEESNVLPDVNGNVPISDISDLTYTSSSIGPSYSFDSRDNPFDTTRGGRVSAGLTFSGGPLGGTIHAIRPTFAATKFFKLSRKSSFSVNVDLGYLRPLDYGKGCALTYDDYVDQNSKLCVPKGQRFFVGGEYSVRGFEYGTLGPTEKFGGIQQIAGGYKQVFFNSEYIYRLNDPLRLVFFADGGWAYGYNDKIDPRKLRYSTGAELRIFLPVFQFPIRFIYAINPVSKPGDKFKTFNFTIGNTY